MKKIISTLALVIGIIWQLQAQVTGFAYLSGQTDHSGIKVKFIAKSPSAKTDSTFTNVDGSYSKGVQAGAYLIQFTKIDFDSLIYNSNFELISTSSKILDSKTLLEKQYILTGNITGILKKNRNYLVIGDLNILEGDSVLIEQGAKITGILEKTINIYGVINSKGDSINKIFFKNIIFNVQNRTKINNDFLKFNNCVFDSSYIKSSYSSTNLPKCIVIQNCEFFNSKHAINSYCDSAIIENNYIHDLYNFAATFWGSAISLQNKSGVVVKCNKIKNCFFMGISVINLENSFGKSLVENNFIQNIFNNDFGMVDFIAGILLSNGTAKNNIIKNANVGFLNYAIYPNILYNTVIEQNTIINCKEGALNFQNNLNWGNIKNNVFVGNKLIIGIRDLSNVKKDTVSNNSFRNNLFYGHEKIANFDNNTLGVVFSTNQNGDFVDVYSNVLTDPQFLNSNQVSYKSSSPIYGAGLNGTNIGFDPKGTCLENEWFLGSIDSLTLSGTVHQASSYLKNGEVLAYNIDNNTFKETITDANGNFTFDSLAIGNYVIKAIPNNGENYLTTFFPNKSDSLSAFKINLDADITSVDIFMNSITGIDNTIGGGVITKPNPFENQLFVKVLENTSSGIQASISNAVGDFVTQLSIPANENEFSINTNELPSGFYFLKVETGTKVLVQKVLKQ